MRPNDVYELGHLKTFPVPYLKAMPSLATNGAGALQI